MFSFLLAVGAGEREDIITGLWGHGTVGLIEESPERFRAFFENEQSVADASRFFHASLLEIRKEATDTQVHPAALSLDPILVGQRFVVAPSWITADVPEDRLRLTVDARSAFGSGRHESTQLMLEALERYDLTGKTVVDVGCGSGILCVAAKLLGGRTIIGCDIDLNAMTIAKEMPDVVLFAGSADALTDECADIVLANISTKVIDVIGPDLHRITKPGGMILVSGFIRDSVPRRFVPEASLTKGDWLCWACRPDVEITSLRVAPTRHPREWW